MNNLRSNLSHYFGRKMRILGAACGVLLLLSGAVMFAYENIFVTYPASPDPATSRIVPYVVKQRLVRYVTRKEYLVATASNYVFFPSLAVGFLLSVLQARRKLKRRERDACR